MRKVFLVVTLVAMGCSGSESGDTSTNSKDGGGMDGGISESGANTVDAGRSDSSPMQDGAAHPADEVLVGAGDIATCSNSGSSQTAALVSTIAGTVFVAGDNAYENGTSSEYNNCYHPTWGAFKARTKPVPGNHEYGTSGASGYYGYFGAAAGDPTKGYYSYDLGSWHIVALNSNCSEVGGCNAGSAQEQWLRADLQAHPSVCTLAYWHHPLFNIGQHGNTTNMKPIWQALYDNNADVVLSGHDHNYQRWAPLDAQGNKDNAKGIREFVVGTGGKDLYSFVSSNANIEKQDSNSWGVIKLTLRASSYAWEFVPVAGKSFTDSGTANCH